MDKLKQGVILAAFILALFLMIKMGFGEPICNEDKCDYIETSGF